MSAAAARNLVIVLVLAGAVAFVPGGGTTASVVVAVLSTLILASLVLLAARFYREHRIDLDGLGDRWRTLLYAAIGVAIVAAAAGPRLRATSSGTIAWIVLLCAAAYAVYLVWRRYREYG
jgi:hypothetical protein